MKIDACDRCHRLTRGRFDGQDARCVDCEGTDPLLKLCVEPPKCTEADYWKQRQHEEGIANDRRLRDIALQQQTRNFWLCIGVEVCIFLGIVLLIIMQGCSL